MFLLRWLLPFGLCGAGGSGPDIAGGRPPRGTKATQRHDVKMILRDANDKAENRFFSFFVCLFFLKMLEGPLSFLEKWSKKNMFSYLCVERERCQQSGTPFLFSILSAEENNSHHLRKEKNSINYDSLIKAGTVAEDNKLRKGRARRAAGKTDRSGTGEDKVWEEEKEVREGWRLKGGCWETAAAAPPTSLSA